MKINRSMNFSTVAVVALFYSVSIAAPMPSSANVYAEMMSKLKSLKSYQVTIQETTILQPTDPGAKPRTLASTDQVAYQSPNRFSLVNDGLMGGITIVSNGSTEYFYSSLAGEYAARPAPTDVLSSVLGAMHVNQAHWGAVTQSAIDGTPVKWVQGTLTTPRGTVIVSLYVRRSNNLPVKVVLTLPMMSGATGSGLNITRIQLFTDEKLNEQIPGSVFSFIPPAGSTKVDSPSDLGGGFAGGS